MSRCCVNKGFSYLRQGARRLMIRIYQTSSTEDSFQLSSRNWSSGPCFHQSNSGNSVYRFHIQRTPSTAKNSSNNFYYLKAQINEGFQLEYWIHHVTHHHQWWTTDFWFMWVAVALKIRPRIDCFFWRAQVHFTIDEITILVYHRLMAIWTDHMSPKRFCCYSSFSFFAFRRQKLCV